MPGPNKNTVVQHSIVNKCLCNMLIKMPCQNSLIGNKHPGFYMDKYST